MMKVEMQYGQNTTRWQITLSTRWRSEDGGAPEDGGASEDGGPVVVGLPAERSPPGQVNICMNEVLKSKVTSSPETESQLLSDSSAPM